MNADSNTGNEKTVPLNAELRTLMQESLWERAAELLESALDKDPSDTQLLSQAVMCYRNKLDENLLQKLYDRVFASELTYETGRYVTNGLSFLNQETRNPHDNFVFVSGAGRSGTTSLGRILNLHEEVALLTERFTPYFGYHPDMFLTENIFSPGYKKHRHAPKMERLRKRLKTCTWIGDKRPNFAYGLPATLKNFRGKTLTVFHIYRKIADVCWSYEHKKKRSLDEWTSEQACFDYNYNNRAISMAAAQRIEGVEIHVVDYRRLHSDAEYTLNIFRRMGLDVSPELEKSVADYIESSAQILGKDRDIGDDISNYIERHADRDAEAALLRLMKD